MKRHWQRKPLLVRQAMPGVVPPATRADLLALCERDGVESRCIEQRDGRWRLRHGPLTKRQLPPISRVGWTLLVQGLDLHCDAAHAMLRAFDFIAHARLDDLMVSWASDGGGVGPHVDSYDVFLLQVQGRRRWRVAPPGDAELVPGLPLRILANFKPEQEWVLEPGDMLYLPPGWGHDGVALGGDCMTASIGFRAPTAGELTAAMLQRLADEVLECEQEPRTAAERRAWQRRYGDLGCPPVEQQGEVPQGLMRFAQAGLEQVLKDGRTRARVLGGWLTEPKPQVWFEQAQSERGLHNGVALDRRTRMAYDRWHLFINGDAFVVGGRDARLLRRLADQRQLDARSCAQLSIDARQALEDWLDQGWLQPYPY